MAQLWAVNSLLSSSVAVRIVSIISFLKGLLLFQVKLNQ